MALPRRQRRRDWLAELCSEGPTQVTTKHFILSSSGNFIFQIQTGFDFQKCYHEHFYFPEILKSEFGCLHFSVCDWCHWHRARKSERFISYPMVPRKNIFKVCLSILHLTAPLTTSDCCLQSANAKPPQGVVQQHQPEQYPSSNIHNQTTLDLEIKFHDANKWHQTWLSLGPCVCCGTLLGAPSDKSQNQIPTHTFEVHKPC